MKRIITVQDISCVGKCSLTVALPIISAMGVEACVRNGGDEFAIVGLGRYTDKQIKERIRRFNELINDYNKNSPVPFNASIGYCIKPWGAPTAFEKALEQADVNMYLDKRQKKNRR